MSETPSFRDLLLDVLQEPSTLYGAYRVINHDGNIRIALQGIYRVASELFDEGKIVEIGTTGNPPLKVFQIVKPEATT